MSYTDRAGKTIEDAFGIFKVVLGSNNVVPGDLIGPVTASDAWLLADEDTGPVTAQAIALERGDSGDTITACQACNIRTKPTCTAGVWAEVALAAAGDVGSPLYISSTAGKASSSAGGTTVQIVGVITSIYTASFGPGGYLTSTSATLSGNFQAANVAATGTLTVTGITTLTGETHTAGGVHIGGTSAPGVDNLVVDGTALVSGTGSIIGNALIGGTASIVGAVTHDGALTQTGVATFANTIVTAANKGLQYGGNSSASVTGASLFPGLNVITTGAAGSYTLPAYTAGTIVEVATAGAAGSVTIIGPSASCFNTASAASRLVSQAAASEGIRLAAVSATRYAIIGPLTGWNPTN
jgi:hypothetical protein